MTLTITLADIARVVLGIAIGYKFKSQFQAGINSIKKSISGLVAAKA